MTDIQPNVLEKMAKTIHDNYNKTQLERNPYTWPSYPTWESLPDTLKNSNIRQAKGVFEKLQVSGYIWSNEDLPGFEEIADFSDDEIEPLSKLEHDRWVEERIESGWKYGHIKDVDLMISPYIAPYDDIPDEIKEYDRDAVRNVFPLIHSLGMKVYKKSEC